LKTNEVNINRSTIVCLFGKDIKKFIRFVLMKPNKEHLITSLLHEIEKGRNFTECVAFFELDWSLGSSTLKRYWKIASERFRERQGLIQKELALVSMDMEKERLKRSILTRFERQEILSKIADGKLEMVKHIVCDGVIQEVYVVPAWADRKAAISELNKMDGEYAPVKKDVTSNGETIRIDFTD
jgi:hypothetical protein